MSETIRQIFSPRRPIDRTIEKVIDYYAQEEDRLSREIGEYEVTDNIESCFRKFLDVFGEGVGGGQMTEVGIWVSGFYGSGKSSFTKYLGAALDPSRTVQGKPFLDLLCDRFPGNEIPAALRTVSKKHPTAVVLLDLGSEQLAESAAAPVSTVLYWKVLQWAGFSKEKKTAQLEFTLDRRGKYAEFKEKYRARYKGEWEEIHNDPLIGVARASEIVPEVLPDDFPTPESFRGLRFEEARDVRDLAAEIIELCRRKTGHENILLLVDEAGQYVAPRGELILNMDGLARNLKELGKGKVWIAATGQQTLSEIVEKAAHNSAELNKLRDRFPISIHLDAGDIREITHRRLLDKSEEGRERLSADYKEHGQSTVTHTRLTGTALFKGDPDAETFVRLYPFLPQHFDLLLELIRTLARSTGGIGLRSAIRVIQDVLVDKSRVLGADAVKLADRDIGSLACVDDFYDTLKADIAKVLPHVIGGVEKRCANGQTNPWPRRFEWRYTMSKHVPVLFDKALEIAVGKVKRVGGIFGRDIVLVRDLRGRIRVLVPGYSKALSPQQKEAGLNFGRDLSESLGAYGFPSDRIVLYADDLFQGNEVLASRDRRLITEENGIQVWILDRQITGQDWMRSPLQQETQIPRVTFFGIKGGVGRSTALVIWAWRLAGAGLGKKILILDLDLESPGVSSTLLPSKYLPDYGIVDWFVEDGVGQAEAVENHMIAASPLVGDLSGDIQVVPAFGRDTGDYLPKLARCYAESDAGGHMSWAERLQKMVQQLERQEAPDLVILDSRAGLHDIAAATVTRMGADAFLFAVNSMQTWNAYAFLFRHWRLHPQLTEFRQKLQIVAGMAPETGREPYLKSFRENAWDLFREHLYDETGAQVADNFSFDLDSLEAPHYPLPIFWNRSLQEFNPLQDDSEIDQQIAEAAMGKFMTEAERMVFRGEEIP